MKKRTNEEKLQMVNDACDLINEGIDKINEAKRLLHLCGIEICDSVDTSALHEWIPTANNVQIFRGIPKMEKIIGVNGNNPIDCITGKPDMRRKRLKYRGVIFLQLASESNTKFRYR